MPLCDQQVGKYDKECNHGPINTVYKSRKLQAVDMGQQFWRELQLKDNHLHIKVRSRKRKIRLSLVFLWNDKIITNLALLVKFNAIKFSYLLTQEN